MRPKTKGGKGVSAPNKSKFRQTLANKMGRGNISIDAYKVKELEEGGNDVKVGNDVTGGNDSTSVDASWRMGQFSVVALGALAASL